MSSATVRQEGWQLMGSWCLGGVRDGECGGEENMVNLEQQEESRYEKWERGLRAETVRKQT